MCVVVVVVVLDVVRSKMHQVETVTHTQTLRDGQTANMINCWQKFHGDSVGCQAAKLWSAFCLLVHQEKRHCISAVCIFSLMTTGVVPTGIISPSPSPVGTPTTTPAVSTWDQYITPYIESARKSSRATKTWAFLTIVFLATAVTFFVLWYSKQTCPKGQSCQITGGGGGGGTQSKTICEHATESLTCSTGKIDIDSATFGKVSSATTCGSTSTGTTGSADVKTTVVNKCNNQTSCSLVAENATLTPNKDPCVAGAKQLAVSYRCV